MPSLRQKVTTYFRQLSFIAEPRDGPRSPRKTDDDENFIIKYLEGRMDRIFTSPPEIYNGQNPTDLPEWKIGNYPTGPHTITAACTGPDEGLTGIKRSKLHLSASYADDIDFIDTIQDTDCYEVRKSISHKSNHNHRYHNSQRGVGARKLSNGAAGSAIGGSDQNANNNNNNNNSGGGGSGSGNNNNNNNSNSNSKMSGMRSRKNSKTGIANLTAKEATSKATNTTASTIGTATADKTVKASQTKTTSMLENEEQIACCKSTTIVVSMVSTSKTMPADDQNNKNLLNTTTTNGTTAASTTTTATAATNAIVLSKDAKMLTAAAAANSLLTTTTENNGTTITTLETVTAAATKCATDATTKLLENATELLLQEAVSNQAVSQQLSIDVVAGVSNWKMETESSYGISVSLYENNMLTKEPMGNPIADCYGIVARGDAAVMALADGVNWGDGARLAARSAVHGCLDYLDRAIFGLAQECMATTTHEVFVSLLRSLWEGHGCILEVGGALSTLTVAVVLPLHTGTDGVEGDHTPAQRYVVCACNVGDSLGYVYSKKHGVREFTQASHDITSMRDMRDALGALGPADGNKPELSNLTLSMTVIERGDIVFLTSDGVSDNFDPVVGKFAEAWTPDVKLMPSTRHHGPAHGGVLAPKRQNKSASAIYARLHRQPDTSSMHTPSPVSSPPVRPPRTKKASSPPESSSVSVTAAPSRPKYMRSHTVIEPRRPSSAGNPAHRQMTASTGRQDVPLSPKIPKSAAGLPLVTGPQRHALTLHRLADMLSYGINGTFSPCISARRLCHLLIDFVRMITSARRKTLEQRELFYKLATGPDGIKREVELNRMQHRAARKRIVDSSAFSALPGKLDHATVVAYTVGSGNGSGNMGNAPAATDSVHFSALKSQEFDETNF